MSLPAVITRRRLVRSAAELATLAAGATLLPPNVRKLLAQTPRRAASLKDIKHVVLLMQENRSFDHYFGTLAGVRGFSDPTAVKLTTGNNVFHQPDPKSASGFLLPFHLDTRSTNAQSLPSTDHGWTCQHAAWNGGSMDRWVTAHRAADGSIGPYTMGYFKREDIPFHYALADAFTLCDGYHCSVLGPTLPNRMYWMTGSIDPFAKDGGPAIDERVHTDGYTWTTYVERLEDAGISWKVYQHEPEGLGFNILRMFRRFIDAPVGSPLKEKGVSVVPEGLFEYDAIHDRLPAVSWLLPPTAASEHPSRMPAAGAEFIAAKLDALATNPDVWAKTAFIINYDENDGLFDHVPPPVPRPGTQDEFIDGEPIGAGFRVPCIIVSPWTAGGWVCSERFDHTSILRFLELMTGVREPNISPWRRRSFGDLTSAFRFEGTPGGLPTLPGTRGLLNLAHYAATHLPNPSIPSGNQTEPGQEEGSRKTSSSRSTAKND
jgi:phospholipase C